MRLLISAALLVASTPMLTSCITMGDTDDVKLAYSLAIDCKTGEALAALDRAESGGGLSAYIADLQRIVILEDAGRMQEAEAAMAEYNKQSGAGDPAETRQAVADSLNDIQTEREKKTGQRTCRK